MGCSYDGMNLSLPTMETDINVFLKGGHAIFLQGDLNVSNVMIVIIVHRTIRKSVYGAYNNDFFFRCIPPFSLLYSFRVSSSQNTVVG